MKFIVAKCESKTSGPIHFNIHLDEFENFNKQKKYSKLPKPFSNKLKTNYSWDQIPYQDIFNIVEQRYNQGVRSSLDYRLAKSNLLIAEASLERKKIETDWVAWDWDLQFCGILYSF